MLRKYILAGLITLLPLVINAEDRRIIPLDMYLIIDDSSALQNSKKDAIAWINDHVIDKLLVDGDKITVWAAGDRAQVIQSETISGSAGKNAVKNRLGTLNSSAKTADYTGALRDVVSRISQSGQDNSRLPYTMLVTGSAEGLVPALTGGNQSLLRWFRSEEYSRWQVLVVGPDIGRKVQQAAASYMNSQR